MLTKIKEMKKNFKNSFAYALLFAPVMLENAYADADDDIKLNTLMPKVFKQVTDMAMWIGAFLLLWGLVQFGLALRNEDSDSKSRSIMVIVAAIVLMGIKAIFNTIAPEVAKIPEK